MQRPISFGQSWAWAIGRWRCSICGTYKQGFLGKTPPPGLCEARGLQEKKSLARAFGHCLKEGVLDGTPFICCLACGARGTRHLKGLLRVCPGKPLAREARRHRRILMGERDPLNRGKVAFRNAIPKRWKQPRLLLATPVGQLVLDVASSAPVQPDSLQSQRPLPDKLLQKVSRASLAQFWRHRRSRTHVFGLWLSVLFCLRHR